MCKHIVCKYVYTCIHTYAWLYVRVYRVYVPCVWIYVMCVRLHVAVITNLFGETQTRSEIYVRCGPGTPAIRRPIHEMIQRFVPVRAVKIRRWFGFKTTSFHVRVCSYVFLYLLLAVDFSTFVRIISCDCIIYFTSMITYISSWDISEYSRYLCNWFEQLSVSFHVLVVCHCWLRPSIRIP